MDVRINAQWKNELKDTFNQEYWTNLASHIHELYIKTAVYPPPKDIFRAFDLCPFDKVKVVILGQDPYHGKGQANGLCFSVNEGLSLPPSLKNIYKEIHSDLGITPNPSGDLSRWAKQGVLLLNSVLTVLANKPASHAGMGWEKFTDEVIQKLSQNKKHVVYMLWGKYAQKKGEIIDKSNNLVLSSGHPSPFSEKLFFGNHHFTKCNAYLEKHGLTPINWH